MKRAEEIVKNYLIEPFKEKDYRYIGMEFEYPVICRRMDVSLKEIGSAFLRELVEKHGYQEEIRGTDGYFVRVSRDGDSVSFDCTYNLFEVSLGKQESIIGLRHRLFPILRLARDFYREYDCILPGMGTRPIKSKNIEYTYDPFYTMIRRFVTEYANIEEPGEYFADMCSVQTHIDVPYDDLLDIYNLFNRMDFVRGLLFSNSLYTGVGQGAVYCVRDLIWEKCGIPNTGIYNEIFRDFGELAAALSQEKMFVEMRGDGLTGIEPESLNSYFDREDVGEERIRFFRSFKRVVLNGYHALEVRGDCIQPVRESFVTAAFHVGIACHYKKAAEELERFLSENKIALSNAQLRRMAVTGCKITGEDQMKAFLSRMTDIAKEGLLQRGYGEESLLMPLQERAGRLSNPARDFENTLKRGEDIWRVIEDYAEIPDPEIREEG